MSEILASLKSILELRHLHNIVACLLVISA